MGAGADGKVDLARTASVLRAAGRPEIICLQEVACGWAGLKGQPEPLDGPRCSVPRCLNTRCSIFPAWSRAAGPAGCAASAT